KAFEPVAIRLHLYFPRHAASRPAFSDLLRVGSVSGESVGCRALVALPRSVFLFTSDLQPEYRGLSDGDFCRRDSKHTPWADRSGPRRRHAAHARRTAYHLAASGPACAAAFWKRADLNGEGERAC